MKSNRIFIILLVVALFAGVGLVGMKIWHLDNKMPEEEPIKKIAKDLSGLQELLNSPIPMWQCGDPPTWVPKREDYPNIKEFHMAVASFRAHSYAWMSCAVEYIYVYPLAVDEWGGHLIEDNEVIIQ